MRTRPPIQLCSLAAVAVAVFSLPATASTVKIERSDGKLIVVDWPSVSKQRTVAPGARFRVAVRQARQGARPLELRLVRLSGSPVTLRRVRLARGTATVGVSKTPGRRYALRLLNGDKQVRSLLITVAKPPSTAPVTPAPSTTPPGGAVPIPSASPCPDAGTLAGQLDVLTPTVAPGTRGSYSVLNTGQVCISSFSGARLERREGTTWVAVPVPAGSNPTTLEPRRATPGQRLPNGGFLVPADAPAGSYRLLGELYSTETTVTQRAIIEAPFTVQP